MIWTINTAEWFPNLDAAISSGDIRTFRTAKSARIEAVKWGWNNSLVRIQRRFESVYIIGILDLQTECDICGIEHQVLRIPALKYVERNGVKSQPVIKFKRVKSE